MMLSSSSLSLLLCLRCLRLHCLCHTHLVLMKSWRGCVSAFHVKLPKTCSRLSQSCQPWINQRRTLVKQQRQQLDHKAMVNFIAWWSVQCSASLCSQWYLNSFHNETMVFWSSNHRSQWSYNVFFIWLPLKESNLFKVLIVMLWGSRALIGSNNQ